MKRIILTITILVILLASVVSCSSNVSISKYNELLSQYSDLQAKQDELSTEYASIQEQINVQLSQLESELETAKQELVDTKSDYSRMLKQNQELRDELQDYRDTGITISSIDRLPRTLKYDYMPSTDRVLKDSDYVILTNNPESVNPTFSELMTFLKSDDTDSASYSFIWGSGGKLCGWFAEQLHNRAEQAGIRSAFVSVDFKDEWIGHALNAFNTTDKGLVFVDCTGDTPDLTIPTFNIYTRTYIIGDTGSCDTIAYLEKGKPIGWINIGLPYALDYHDYEQWEQDVNAMKQRFHNAPDSQLSQIVRQSDTQLGSFFEPSKEVVSDITIYW
jgi:outer membrane murein-binding lipoprotein Lpp